ncbi:MAG: caspase family protein [Gammaproteobacteria bacterium]|nr:caspase family protein [Gammaproteobacteria bacterium]
MAKRHAVIIGVNKYPNLAHVGNYDLHGCVNDAKLMKSILVDKFKFAETEIVELHNEQASRDAIIGQMNRLVDEVDKGDVVVFHFSGHGSRRRAADEDAAKDSTIMPSDSGRDPKPNRDISDIEVNEWLARLSQRTQYITLTFDCCHSGTMTRDAFGDTARVVVDDNRKVEEMDLAADAAGTLDRSKLGPSGFLMNSESYVVMSGCRDDQLSREFSQEDKGPEFRNGALTYFLTQALLQAKPGTTYRDVFEPARLNVIERYKGDQTPQIEGRQDREIFGVRDIEAIRFIPVESVDGDHVSLAGGAAHGLHTGSLWSVYPSGTKTTDGATTLGIIEITEVDALKTKGLVRETHGEITAGARCVEKVPSQTQFQLKVDLGALSDKDRKAIKPGIEKSSLLTLSKSADSADMGVYVLQPRDSAKVSDPIPHIQQVQTPTWAVVDAAGMLAMPLHATSENKVVEILVKNLETRARFKNALNLDNPDSKLDVEFNIYEQLDDDNCELANGGDCVFNDGDRISFEIINNEKDAVYVSLLDFEATGAISLFYPPRGSSEMIEAGKSLRIGRGNQVLRLKLDDAVKEDVAVETLKALITNNETDFRWLEQGATRSIGQSRLRKQFEAAYNGPTTRAVIMETEEEEADDWKSINRFFNLKRRLV